MTDTATLGLWVLLTITGGGNTSTATLPTREACEDAASIALTGMTVAEKKKADADYAAAEKKRRDDWYAAHPPREPKTDDERKAVKEEAELRKKGFVSGGWSTCGGACQSAHYTDDLKIQEDPPYSSGMSQGYYADKGEWVEWAHGDSIIHPPTDIKTAKCFLSAEAAPKP